MIMIKIKGYGFLIIYKKSSLTDRIINQSELLSGTRNSDLLKICHSIEKIYYKSQVFSKEAQRIFSKSEN